jgi:RNA polymerase sigma-70 factor, ECF subfamily
VAQVLAGDITRNLLELPDVPAATMNREIVAHSPAESDDELLLRIRSGDEQAFLSLYRRCRGVIYGYATHMSGSSAVGEDITQEVFMVLIRDECGYDSERGTLSGYLLGIARNLVLRLLEKSRTDVQLDIEADEPRSMELAVEPSQLSALTRKEGVKALRHAIQALPARYREVVVLCDLEEMDYLDAAAVLGCPVGTVRSRLHRARALLLERLQHGWGGRPRDPKPVRCSI